jgi:D-tyrosyl-tRNA(Tyr) deacylase
VRAVVQRVREASVSVEEAVVGKCGRGLVVLLGIASTDGDEEVARLATKIARLRIFENQSGRLDLSVLDIGGEALIVSRSRCLRTAGSRRERDPTSRKLHEKSRLSASTNASARRCGAWGCPWRPESSVPGWRSRSSTTGL